MLGLSNIHPFPNMYAVRVQVSIHVSKNKDLIPFGYGMQGLSELRPEFDRFSRRVSLCLVWLDLAPKDQAY